MVDFDRSAFIDTFCVEAAEHIQKMETGLLNLEKDEPDEDVINELFRNAHSLKGSSALMGFDDISVVAHSMEDIFGEIRTQQRPTGSKVVDELLSLLDKLKEQLALIDIEALDSEGVETTEAVVVVEEAEKEETKNEAVKAKPKPRPPKKEEAPRASKEIETIRVTVAKLDALLNLAGELVVNKLSFDSPLNEINSQQESVKNLLGIIGFLKEFIEEREELFFGEKYEEAMMYLGELEELSVGMKDSSFRVYESLRDTVGRLEVVSDSLQQRIMSARMLPIATIFDLFPRAVRDLAKEHNKKVKLQLLGEDVELDKKVIEEISEPLMHLLRNSIDHGIMTPRERTRAGKNPEGTIVIEAANQGGQIVISIADDGVGIDEAKIKKTIIDRRLLTAKQLAETTKTGILNYIFSPGFSTKETISDISGRGVGMDVVKKNVEALKGLISIVTKKGQGTKITLKLPLTLTIIQALLVVVCGEVFCIPLSLIEESLRLSPQDVKWAENHQVIELRDRIIPLVDLGKLLHIAPQKEIVKKEALTVIIVGSAEERVGFIVDRLAGRREIVSKPLSKNLEHVKNISGATILSDGTVALILNISALLDSAKAYRPERDTAQTSASTPQEEKKRYRILVVDDSMITRQLEKNILESAGYQVAVAVDGIDGLDLLRKERFDLVVTDIEMPHLDGFELTSAIKKTTDLESIPVVIVTSIADEENKVKGIEVGADAYVVKSDFEQKNLIETIGLLLGES